MLLGTTENFFRFKNNEVVKYSWIVFKKFYVSIVALAQNNVHAYCMNCVVVKQLWKLGTFKFKWRKRNMNNLQYSQSCNCNSVYVFAVGMKSSNKQYFSYHWIFLSTQPIFFSIRKSFQNTIGGNCALEIFNSNLWYEFL